METDWTDIKGKLLVTKEETKVNVAGKDRSGAWDEHIQTIVYKVDNQKGSTV